MQISVKHLHIPLLPLPSPLPFPRRHRAPGRAPWLHGDLSPVLALCLTVWVSWCFSIRPTPSLPRSVSTSSILYIRVSIPSLQIGCSTHIEWNSVHPFKENTFESVLVKWMNLEPVTHGEVRKRKTSIVYQCMYMDSRQMAFGELISFFNTASAWVMMPFGAPALIYVVASGKMSGGLCTLTWQDCCSCLAHGAKWKKGLPLGSQSQNQIKAALMFF